MVGAMDDEMLESLAKEDINTWRMDSGIHKARHKMLVGVLITPVIERLCDILSCRETWGGDLRISTRWGGSRYR